MQSFLKYWLPIVLWLALIFIGSTDLMSAEHTSRFIGPFLRWLKPDISAQAIMQVQFFVRKGGHVTEYAILAMLLLRGISHRQVAHKVWIDMAATLVIAIAFAASDEFHQSFVPSRTASPIDVGIDSCGALLGAAIYATARRRKWA